MARPQATPRGMTLDLGLPHHPRVHLDAGIYTIPLFDHFDRIAYRT